MSDAVALAIVAAAAPTLLAAATLILGVLNRTKLAQVHTLTNSNLEKMRMEATADRSELKAAVTEIAALKATAVALAASKEKT